jgi:hydrogenase-1 operon protein HyaF
MKPSDPLVHTFRPGGSEDSDPSDQLDYLPLPREINSYSKPLLPEPEAVKNLSRAMEAMAWLQGALGHYRVGGQPRALDISTLDAHNRDLVNQILGEGEVSVLYRGEFSARIQESVLAGVWRTFYLDQQHSPVRDIIEVCDAPSLARSPAANHSTDLLFLATNAPADASNARPILVEIQERLAQRSARQPAHVINLTLLPLSESELAFLDQALGIGPIRLLSRGYGDCRIDSTGMAGVWWVRYFNAADKLILNTLEVVDLPAVACAAQEDLDDSRQRLGDILDAYR